MVGFPAAGGRRVIPENRYPFTLTVSALHSHRMISKVLVFRLIAPMRFDHPTDAPTTLEVPEYLGRTGVAPVGYPLAPVRTQNAVTVWSIVGNPPGYRLATTAMAATIELAQTINLDFESRTVKEFATLTIAAAGRDAGSIREESRITVVLKVTDANITIADTTFEPLADYIRFAGSGEQIVAMPQLRLNGLALGIDAVDFGPKTFFSHGDVYDRYFETAQERRFGNAIRILSSAPVGALVSVTLGMHSAEGSATVTTRIRLLERPHISRVEQKGSHWEFELSSAFRCDLMVFVVSHGGSDESEPCSGFSGSMTVGGAVFNKGTTDGDDTMLIFTTLPASGELGMGAYFKECDSHEAAGRPEQGAACRTAGGSSFSETFVLPIAGPLIAGGARQVIRIPSWDGSWRSVGGSPGQFPAGHIIATVSLAPGFEDAIDWSLVGSSQLYELEPVSGSRVHVVLKTDSAAGRFSYPGDAPPIVLTLKAASRADANIFSTSVITFELLPPARGTSFRQIGPRTRNIVSVVPDIERLLTIWGVADLEDPNTRIEGEYRAEFGTGPLPYWLRFDPATRVFTIRESAASAPGDYRIRMQMIDRRVSPPRIIEQEFTLRILEPLHFRHLGHSAGSYNAAFYADGLYKSGDTGNDRDSISFLFNGETTTFVQDIECGVNVEKRVVGGATVDLAVNTGNASDTYTAAFYPECYPNDNSIRLLVQSRGVGSFTTSDVVTLSLEINIGGVRQTVVHVLKLGNTPANIGGTNAATLTAPTPEVITRVGGTVLAEGHVLAPGTELFTLTIASPPSIAYSTGWQLEASDEHLRLFEIHDASNSDATAVLRVRSGVPVTLDYDSMGDIQLGGKAGDHRRRQQSLPEQAADPAGG